MFYFPSLYPILSGMPMPSPNIGMPPPNPGGLYGAAPSMPQPGGGYPSGNLSFGVSINRQLSTVNLYMYVLCMGKVQNNNILTINPYLSVNFS